MEQGRESGVASAASVLLPDEVAQIAAIALALPDGWVVVILAPDGQLAIGPEEELPYHTRCHQADKRRRSIRRQPLRLA